MKKKSNSSDTFGSYIRKLRIKNDIGQRELAKQIGVIKKLHISSESKITFCLIDTPQIQKLLEFDQWGFDFPCNFPKSFL